MAKAVIVIVECDEALLASQILLFEAQGHQVFSARTRKSAEQLLNQSPNSGLRPRIEGGCNEVNLPVIQSILRHAKPSGLEEKAKTVEGSLSS